MLPPTARCRLQPRCIAGKQQALAGKEGQESSGHAVVAQPLVFHGQQRGRHHECHAVDRPERFAQRSAGDEGAGKAKGTADGEAERGDSV